MANIRIAAPETAEKGEIIELKALIQHKMESGFQLDSRGEPIPRDIIKRFECRFDGAPVFSAEFFPSVAANPLLAFHMRAETSGTLTFEWTDQHGATWSETAELTVR